MHCSGFEVNNKPRDLPFALFFFIKKKKKKKGGVYPFHSQGEKSFLRHPHILLAHSANFYNLKIPAQNSVLRG